MVDLNYLINFDSNTRGLETARAGVDKLSMALATLGRFRTARLGHKHNYNAYKSKLYSNHSTAVHNCGLGICTQKMYQPNKQQVG